MHPCPLNCTPLNRRSERRERPFKRRQHRHRRVILKYKPGSVAGPRITLADGICEPTGRANYRYGAATHTVHLVESAWFKAGRHEENIRTSFDQMRQLFIEANAYAESVWVGIG